MRHGFRAPLCVLSLQGETGSLTREHSAQRMTIRPGPAMNPLTALGIFALAIVIAGVVGAGLLAKRAHEMDSGDPG